MKTGRMTAQAEELFVAYSAGTLAPAEAAAFVRHLESCGECRSLAAAQAEVWAALDSWIPAPVASNFDELLYARIAAEQHSPWWQRALKGDFAGLRNLNLSWSWKPAMPVAAACTALLCAFLLKSPAPEHQPQVSVQSRVDIEQVERALDDIDMLQQLNVVSTLDAKTPARPKDL